MADSQPLQTQAHVDFIVHLIVRSERAEEVQAAQRQFEQAARLSPGYIRSRVEELSDPPPGCRAFAAVHRFATPRELIGWLESDQRKKLIDHFRAQYGEDTTIDYPAQLAGFSAWFAPPETVEPAHQGPTTWKQSLIVLVALYPLILILSFLVPQILPNAHPLTIRLLCAVIAVGLMGFFVVPRLARLLRPWIVATGFWPQFAGAIALIGGLLLLWLALHAVYPETPSEDRTVNSTPTSNGETAGLPQRASHRY